MYLVTDGWIILLPCLVGQSQAGASEHQPGAFQDRPRATDNQPGAAEDWPKASKDHPRAGAGHSETPQEQGGAGQTQLGGTEGQPGGATAAVPSRYPDQHTSEAQQTGTLEAAAALAGQLKLHAVVVQAATILSGCMRDICALPKAACLVF